MKNVSLTDTEELKQATDLLKARVDAHISEYTGAIQVRPDCSLW